MREHIAQVTHNQLMLLGGDQQNTAAIPVGSEAWYSWVTDLRNRAFSLRNHRGTFTARCERQGNSWYWYLYSKRAGKLYKAYLGKAETLTPERLDTVAATLVGRQDVQAVSIAKVQRRRQQLSSEPASRVHAGALASSTARDEAAADAGWDALLKTKLALPVARPNLVSRLSLISWMEIAIRHPLTLISAPAGSGKTTLLCDWIRHSQQPVAWLSLDVGDNVLSQIWRYVIAALHECYPALDSHALAVLQAPQPREIESVLIALINAITVVQYDVLLVLDDYHVISNSAIHQAVTFVVDHAPAQLHLVIASRTDPPLPLARFRARGVMAELRDADLRLSHAESRAFLTQTMGLALSAEDATILTERTEGWIVGLQLAALSMQRHANTHDFIAALRGSHHYILDYLTDEVLRQQPASVQSFLLRTAILDRLCGSLCDAVANVDESWAMLRALEQANLFIVPLDDERRWYRYHQLFADALRVRLQQTAPEQLATLHGRAALWYAANGWATQAVSHALAAGDLEHAAHLIERAARTMLMRGEHTTLLEWFTALPDPLIVARPELNLARAWALVQLGQSAAVEPYLRDIERSLQRSHGDTAVIRGADTAQELAHLHAEVLAIRAHMAATQGDNSAAIELICHASVQLPRENLLAHADLLLSLGRVRQACDDLSAASAAFAEVIVMSRAGGNVRAWALAVHLLADVHVAQGQLHQAAEHCQRALEVIAAQGWQELPATSAIHVSLGDLMYEWNELAAAERHLTTGIRLASAGGETAILIRGYIGLSRIRTAQDNPSAATEFLQKAVQLMPGPSLMAFQAWLHLAWGDSVTAVRWVKTCGLHTGDVPTYTREMEHCLLVRVLVAQGAASETLGLLERLHGAAEHSGRAGSLVQILLLQALVYEMLGDSAQALVTLQQALTIAEAEVYIRTIIDAGAAIGALLAKLRRHLQRRRREQFAPSLAYVTRLLLLLDEQKDASSAASAGSQPDRSTYPLVEPLTERECEVLGLLAAGCSTEQIAERLVITVSTVKAHTHNIYGKLAVQSRTHAIAVAREHGLLKL